jgi:hypothetical protein
MFPESGELVTSGLPLAHTRQAGTGRRAAPCMPNGSGRAGRRGPALTTIPQLAPVLVGEPFWSFWWD